MLQVLFFLISFFILCEEMKERFIPNFKYPFPCPFTPRRTPASIDELIILAKGK